MAVTRIWDADNGVWHLVGGAVGTDGGLGYREGIPVRFTASGTFLKADYAAATAFRIQVQAGGGGGAGNGNGDGTGAPGGGGGGYAESIILASALAASVPVTVGQGGGGSSGFNVGTDGIGSSFGTHVVATPGQGGTVGGYGGPPGQGTVGDFLLPGGYGTSTSDRADTQGGTLPGGAGGDSQFGIGGRGGPVRAVDTAGTAGLGYGSGGGGGFRWTAPAGGGGGRNGLVIVTPLYGSA